MTQSAEASLAVVRARNAVVIFAVITERFLTANGPSDRNMDGLSIHP